MLILACITVCKILLACNIRKVESLGKNVLVFGNCSLGQFYSTDYQRCVTCSECDVYSVLAAPCSAASDTVCAQCAHPLRPDTEHPKCKQCPPCPAGQYMDIPCTGESPPVCRTCPWGSYNELASYKKHCSPCSSCENQLIVRDCTPLIDTTCGRCKKGYYRDSSRNICFKCMTCFPGQRAIGECRNGRPGKLCSEFLFTRTDYVAIPVRKPDNVSIETDTANFSYLSTTVTYLNVSASTVQEKMFLIDSSSRTELLNLAITLASVLVVCVLLILIWTVAVRLRKLSTLKAAILSDNFNDDKCVLYIRENLLVEDSCSENSSSENSVNKHNSDGTLVWPGYCAPMTFSDFQHCDVLYSKNNIDR